MNPSASQTQPDAAVTAARVQRLLEQLRSGPDPRAGRVAEELVRGLVRLYGAGLERIVAAVGQRRARQLCADPLVESLLLVHDLHPLGTEARVRRALEGARPWAGEVRYDGVEDGVARVRLAAGAGCRSAVRATVEAAVREAAPELAGVVVQVDAAPAPLLSITHRPEAG